MSDAASMDIDSAPDGLFGADAVKELEPAVYEVGYHLLPTLSGDEAGAAAKDLGKFLAKEGAKTVGEKEPELIDLAYAIEKRLGGKRTEFKTAYFGWVAFRVSPAALVTIKKFMDTNPSVLRSLIIATSEEEVTAFLEGAVIMPTAIASTEAIAAPKRAEESSAVVTDEALSKALEGIESEDK
jgi:ribosomal protein S6